MDNANQAQQQPYTMRSMIHSMDYERASAASSHFWLTACHRHRPLPQLTLLMLSCSAASKSSFRLSTTYALAGARAVSTYITQRPQTNKHKHMSDQQGTNMS